MKNIYFLQCLWQSKICLGDVCRMKFWYVAPNFWFSELIFPIRHLSTFPRGVLLCPNFIHVVSETIHVGAEVRSQISRPQLSRDNTVSCCPCTFYAAEPGTLPLIFGWADSDYQAAPRRSYDHTKNPKTLSLKRDDDRGVSFNSWRAKTHNNNGAFTWIRINQQPATYQRKIFLLKFLFDQLITIDQSSTNSRNISNHKEIDFDTLICTTTSKFISKFSSIWLLQKKIHRFWRCRWNDQSIDCVGENTINNTCSTCYRHHSDWVSSEVYLRSSALFVSECRQLLTCLLQTSQDSLYLTNGHKRYWRSFTGR